MNIEDTLEDVLFLKEPLVLEDEVREKSLVITKLESYRHW